MAGLLLATSTIATCGPVPKQAALITKSSPVTDGGKPGDLVEKIAFAEIDQSIRATGANPFRIRYRSSSAWNGATITVSGSAFIPAGNPPRGGWPVIALAHGTSGILTECGPSLSPNLFGSAPMVAGFLAKGFAVVAADYEGLGEPGVHAYLNARAAGLNVIDSVRALRAVQPGAVSNRWLAVGGSQGGGAVWGANEQAAQRAPDLKLLGVVSIVPAADVADYADLAVAGTMGPDQTAAYVWMVMSLGRGRPDFDMALYRRGSAARNWNALSYCYGPHAEERGAALKLIAPDELKPATPRAAARLKAVLREMALPQERAAAPMLVIYAGRDSFIDPTWTRRAMAAACKRGSKVEAIFQPDKEHGTVDIAPALEWLGHRLAGDPVTGTCG